MIYCKGPFIFHEVGGGWWDLVGGVTQKKKRLKMGGHPKKTEGRGITRNILVQVELT